MIISYCLCLCLAFRSSVAHLIDVPLTAYCSVPCNDSANRRWNKKPRHLFSRVFNFPRMRILTAVCPDRQNKRLGRGDERQPWGQPLQNRCDTGDQRLQAAKRRPVRRPRYGRPEPAVDCSFLSPLQTACSASPWLRRLPLRPLARFSELRHEPGIGHVFFACACVRIVLLQRRHRQDRSDPLASLHPCVDICHDAGCPAVPSSSWNSAGGRVKT